MGNKIMLIGDFKGQFLPIFDRWGESKGIWDLKLAALLVQWCAHQLDGL